LFSHTSDSLDANWADVKSNVPDKRLLIDQVVGSICSCFMGPETNEAVEVQVIKVSLSFSSYFFFLSSINLSFFIFTGTPCCCHLANGGTSRTGFVDLCQNLL